MPSDPRPVFRFAPSPNGELHLGHALSTLVGWEAARAARGRFLLRIEDIDTGRARPEFVSGILQDLRWLGLDWEEPVLVQSTRFAAYAQAAKRLEEEGLLYPCFATRAEIEAARSGAAKDPDGAPLYPGLWKERPAEEIARRKASGEPFALRIDIDKATAIAKTRLAGRPLAFTELGEDGRAQIVPAEPALWGDAVIVRKDVPASYHLAVVVDDAWQGVTHVTRGRDLYAATHLHRLLQVLLDLPEPLYRHHRLVTDTDGRKLAKSARDLGLRSLREGGASPEDVRRLVGLSRS